MIELIVALISAVGGLFLFQAINKLRISREQLDLELKRRENALRIQAAEDKIKALDKETKDKVDAITKEQNTSITGSALADWFNKRRGE